MVDVRMQLRRMPGQSTERKRPVELTHLKFDVSEQIATITLNRPEARNALSPEMRRDLDNVLAVIREKAGDEIFCTYCGAPCRLMVKPKKDKDQADEYAAEEDY